MAAVRLPCSFCVTGAWPPTGAIAWPVSGTRTGAAVVTFPAQNDLGLKVTYSETAGAMSLPAIGPAAVRVFDAKDGKERATLATNPAPLASRLEAATQAAAAAQAAAAHAAAQLAALQKAVDDKKAAAEAAVKASTDAATAQVAATMAKAEAGQARSCREDRSF